MGQEITTTGREMVRDMLKQREGEFAKVLASKIDAEHFTRVALTMIQESPKLLQCSQSSLYTSLLKAAQLHLNCDGLLGEAYLVPFKDKRLGLIAQLLIGYKGLINLAMNTGHYKDVRARIVYVNDTFKISLGTDEFIRHEPTEEDQGEMRGAYAVAVGKDGTPTFEFMFAKHIWKHAKQYSKTWNAKEKKFYSDSIWNTDPEAAFKKTVIRRLCNRLPLSARARAVLAREDRMEAGIDLPLEDLDGVIDVDPAPDQKEDEKTEQGGSHSLEDALNGKADDGEPSIEEEMEEAGKYQDLRIAIDDHIQGLYPNASDKVRMTQWDAYVTKALGTNAKIPIAKATLSQLEKICAVIQET